MAVYRNVKIYADVPGVFTLIQGGGTYGFQEYSENYGFYSYNNDYLTNFTITDTTNYKLHFQPSSPVDEVIGIFTVPSSMSSSPPWSFFYPSAATKKILNDGQSVSGAEIQSLAPICTARYATGTTQSVSVIYIKTRPKELICTYNPNGGWSGRYFDRVYARGRFPALPTATFGNETTNRWYTAKTGGTEVHQGDTVTQTDDFTLYAHWSVPVNTHTLTFNANGGTVSPASRTLEEGAAFGTLPTPTRSGYTFVEWRTAPYVGTLVTSSTKMGTDDVTIYAIWRGNAITITLNANGGTVSPTTKSVENGSAYGILPRPTRSGFIFDGWWTAVTGGTKITATAKPSGNQTVYAHWRQDGGEVVPWVF